MSETREKSERGNLPILLSSFIGRKRELAEVRHLLRTERLVTLTGAGGSGKTRLALRSAEDARGAFEDGAWLVELTALADGALVPQEVASVLDVREQAGRPVLDTLKDHLEARQTLLVLDNCEHLIQACAELVQALLEACPSLTILATSREPLGIAGEVLRIVPPLSLPDRGAGKDYASALGAMGSEAVQLFILRAQGALPDFQLTDENAGAVAEICLRLDGMPLAIELAASRLRALSVQQVAELLVDRFQLLTGGSRTAPARQRTLEATLDWSYALLSDAEREVLQRLSVFAGGCTLPAAQALCATTDIHAAQIVDLLSRLVEKSLVVPEDADGEVRYHLLETIREYAMKRLSTSQGADETRNRHLDYYLNWAEEAETLFLGPELARAMQLFAREHDNVRAALDWSLRSRGKVEAGLRLASAAWNFWRVRGFHSEGRTRLSALLAHENAQAPTLARAIALHRAALHAFYQSDYPACKLLCEQSLELFQRQGAAGRQGVASTLELLAEVASETGRYADARNLYEQSLPIFEEAGDLMGLADALKMLGWHSMRSGDYQQAKRWLEHGLAACRQVGDLRHIASALSGMGELAIRTGRYREARDLLNESLKISRPTGERWNIAINLGSLGWLALLEKDYQSMVEALRASLAIRRETGDRGGIAWCLEKLGEAAAALSNFQAASKVFGAAASLRAPSNSMMDAPDRAGYDRLIAGLRTELGEEAFQATWSMGQAMPLEEAIHLALDAVESATPPSRADEKEQFSGLTAREREVAAFIAQGKSNKEIAEAMTVGVKTVETYVTRILDKLGFQSRVQIATWAVEKQLGASAKEE
jgi:predicted ATPase/DNA-binding CsgD family transcriptional regulator